MKFLGLSVLAGAAFAAPMQARGTAGQVCDNPGRVVSIVLDSSGSTAQTDPSKLRIQGGIDVLDYLTSQTEASDKNKADTVSVVSFDSTATVDYAQGDPNQQARDALQRIDSNGGTSIWSGVRAGLDQILKSNPGDKGGMIVFTDGQDSAVDALVEQINRAKNAGIRISIGHTTTGEHEEPAANGGNSVFTWVVNEINGWLMHSDKTVMVKDPPLDERISQAALSTGGTVSFISTADAQKDFVQQVIKNGITNNDGKCSGNDVGQSGGPLINSVSSLGLCSENTEAVFTYSPKNGDEQLAFAIALISEQSPVNIEATFTNKATGQTSAVTINKGHAADKLTGNASAGQECEVRIKTSNADSKECQYSVTLGTQPGGPVDPKPSPSVSVEPKPSSSAAPAPSSSAAPAPSSSAAPAPSSSAAPAPAPSSECPAAPAASTVTVTPAATTVTVTAPAASATGDVCMCKCDTPGAKPMPKFEL